MTLQVGDKGVWRAGWRPARDVEATVVKVGRKWATLDYPAWGGVKVDKETGHEYSDARSIGDGGQFFTPEMLAAHDRLVEARATMKRHGLSFSYGPIRWSDAEVVALADWLRENRECEDPA